MGMETPATRGLQYGGMALLATCWLPPWILLAVRYEIDQEQLVVHRGPLKRRIPIDDLDEVRASAPLPGLEGVIVRYRRGHRRSTLALYPEDAASFVRRVQEIAPALEPVAEGELRRRPPGA